MRLVDRTGETAIMRCGLYATIIAYGSCNDIDVRCIEKHGIMGGGSVCADEAA